MKYKKRSDNIDSDYEYYICQEDLFHVAFFNFYTNKKEIAKVNYIWKALLKQHKETIK